jgi:poly(glycerol-phosphate) alpha-glucosyltransferase
MSMRIMFVVGRLYGEASGVTRIMCDLAQGLEKQGGSVSLYAAAMNGHPSGAHLLEAPSRYVSEPGMWLGGLASSPRLRRRIDADIDSVDIVHSHSVWMLPNHYASSAALRRGKPVVFTAHGALEPWALGRSSWKKRPVGWWWQDRDLQRAACIHVNTPAEVAGIRAYGLRNPIAVIPNGVDLAAFDGMLRRAGDQRVLLFLSRLHAKKGLSPLIGAWKSLSNDHPDWRLMIAGRDDGAEAATRSQIAELGLQDRITMAGVLEGEQKLAAFASADAFVLPSYSEGFSMAVLEAMAAGLPVVLTPGCNFPQAAASGAAIEVEPETQSLQRGLRELLSMSDTQRCEMGRRARELVQRDHSWDRVATQMMQL